MSMSRIRFDGSEVAGSRLFSWRCADFFSGIGGFHIAATNLGHEVVFACDIDRDARKAYQHNFGLAPLGDIKELRPDEVPDHDLLLAGFPCQPFSIIGNREGFKDPRGSLFFDLLRFIEAKAPRAIVLENVKQLATADNGSVIRRILSELESLGYSTSYKVLNALDFGLPQKRERTIIVASNETDLRGWRWPEGGSPMRPLATILESDPDPKHFVSQSIKDKRRLVHTAPSSPMIWHENKGGNVSSHEWSCALRAGASYNYLLVDGVRRPTPRELLRLQGFPDDWEIVCTDSQTRKQVGNAVPVPMVQAVLERMVESIEQAQVARQRAAA